MPTLESLPFPNTLVVVKALLDDLAPVRLAPPPNFTGGPLITLDEIPGSVDTDGLTFVALVMVSAWGATFPDAADLAARVQVRVLNAGLTQVAGVLIDDTDIYTGPQAGPEPYPDERRINAIYQLAWRRQHRP